MINRLVWNFFLLNFKVMFQFASDMMNKRGPKYLYIIK
jgi:hypothetical protein